MLGDQDLPVFRIKEVNVKLEPMAEVLPEEESQHALSLFGGKPDRVLIFIEDLVLVPGLKSEKFGGFEALFDQHSLVIG
jgi:hypothetical protein